MSKKYKIIYADPPWNYNDKGAGGSASRHYRTLTVDKICIFPIKNISGKDCILFLWATFPCLQEALQVIKAWGFTYKTIGFIWIKINPRKRNPYFGVGHYTRSNSEACLIGTKGSPYNT